MDDKFRNRREQVFNFTVNEILLLIIFLLLLLAAYFIIHNNKLANNNSGLKGKNTELEGIIDGFPKIDKNLCPQGDECFLIKGPKEFKPGEGDYVAVSEVDWDKSLKDAEIANAYPDPKLTNIDQDCVDKPQPCSLIKKPNENLCTKGQDCWLINEPENTKDGNFVLVNEGDYKGLTDSIGKYKKIITDLGTKLKTANDKLGQPEEELDIVGVGPPPCWIEPGTEKDPDWLFNIILHPDGIQFEKDYPLNVADQFKQLPITVDYNKHYSKKEFIESTYDLDKYARNQTHKHAEGCRFFVTIYKNIDDLNMYLEYENLITNVFYTRKTREYNE